MCSIQDLFLKSLNKPKTERVGKTHPKRSIRDYLLVKITSSEESWLQQSIDLKIK